MSNGPRILILGGAGMLGHKMFQTLHTHFSDTACTIRGNLSDSPLNRVDLSSRGPIFQSIDVLRAGVLESLLEAWRPAFIVNCAGIIKQRAQSGDVLQCLMLNAILPHRLCSIMAQWNGRVIHISTDCVFNGRRGGYREEDITDAEDIYGRTKALGEPSAPNCLVLRTSIIGRELDQHRSLLDWFLSQRHRRVRGFTRVIYSGVTTVHLSSLVKTIISSHPDLAGLYQVAGQPISKYDLLNLIAHSYGLDIDIVPDEIEVSDRSMNGTKLHKAIGYNAPPWSEMIRELTTDPTPYERWPSQ